MKKWKRVVTLDLPAQAALKRSFRCVRARLCWLSHRPQRPHERSSDTHAISSFSLLFITPLAVCLNNVSYPEPPLYDQVCPCTMPFLPMRPSAYLPLECIRVLNNAQELALLRSPALRPATSNPASLWSLQVSLWNPALVVSLRARRSRRSVRTNN